MAKNYFISVEKLKSDSVINGNVDPKILNPVIIECQEFYIKPIIGSGIYNDICSQLPSSLTALNKTLMDEYIVPCLIKYIQYEAPIYLNNKLTNANAGTKNTEESNALSLEDTNAIMARFKDKAEWYAQRISLYLVANQVSFPLFTNPGSTVDTIHPNRANYTCGIYLEKTGHCHTCGNYGCNCYTNMRTSSPN